MIYRLQRCLDTPLFSFLKIIIGMKRNRNMYLHPSDHFAAVKAVSQGHPRVPHVVPHQTQQKGQRQELQVMTYSYQ